MEDIKTKLREYFESKGISQQDIATQMGVSKAYVNRLFTGKAKFGKETAEKWGNQFGLSKAWLLTGEGPMLVTGEPQPQETEKGHYISDASVKDLVEVVKSQQESLRKKDEQMDRLLGLLESANGKDKKKEAS